MNKYGFIIGIFFLGGNIVSTATPLSEIKQNDIYLENQNSFEKNNIKLDSNSYILGKGDILNIFFDEFDKIENLSIINLPIGPEGFINLKRIGKIYAEGKTIDQLKKIIEDQYSKFLINKPQVRVILKIYRPLTIYVTGEVSREGYYILTGNNFYNGQSYGSKGEFEKERISEYNLNSLYKFPTLFDAIKAANGVTLYSDLANISVTRKIPEIEGGGLKVTNLNLLDLLVKGDLSNNIDLRDGDVIYVSRSSEKNKNLFFLAAKSNLNSKNIEVFFSGKVESQGKLVVPTGTALNQALNLSGKRLLSGKVEFIRFNKDGSFDKRLFRYRPNAEIDSYENPILMTNDFIRVKDSLFTITTETLNTITAPVITTFGITEILK